MSACLYPLSAQTFCLILCTGSCLNFPVSVASLCLNPLALKSGSRPAQRKCRLPLDSLHFQTLMTDPYIQLSVPKQLVLLFGPELPPPVELAHLIPCAVLFGAESIRAHWPVCQKDMGMGIIFLRILMFSLMNCKHSTHTHGKKHFFDKFLCQLYEIFYG